MRGSLRSPQSTTQSSPTPLTWKTAAVVALLALVAAGPVLAADARVLVLYGGGKKTVYTAQWVVPAVLNLLGHFDCTPSVVPAEAYEAGQISDSDAVIYLGFGSDTALPEALLADIYNTDHPVCWLGGDLEQLAGRFSLGRYGFRIEAEPRASTYTRVLYRSQVLKRAQTALTRVTITDRVSCRAVATTEGGDKPLPYSVKSGRFWYFADVPLLELSETGSSLVLSDQMHEILGQRHPPRRTALITIANVSAQTDASKLRALVGYLQGEKLPFAIAVIPMFKDPKRKVETALSHQRAVVGAVRGAQRSGAAVIDSGYTHQFNGRSGEDAEFWDVGTDRPPFGYTPSGSADRIQKAVAELSRCGLYPVAWSTPQGKASSTDYVEIGRACSTVWERRLTSVLAPGPQTFPFIIKRDSFGQEVIPDNLRPLRKSDEVETILEQARCQTVVPDPWLTVTIAPEAPLDAAKLLVSAVKKMGFEFADLRRRPEWFRGQSLEIHASAEATPITDFIPSGWDATLLGPGRRDLTRFEDTNRDGRNAATLKPGALLIAYPRGSRPNEVFAFEGGPDEVAHRAIAGIARAVVIFAMMACLLLIVIYLAQISLLRRM